MTECTVLNSVDQASLWKQMMTDVAGRCEPNRPGSLHLSENESVSILPVLEGVSTYHSSLGSGRVLCKDIRSLTYWLNALLLHPSSISFWVSLSG